MINKKEKIVVEDLRHINGKLKSFKVKKLVNTIDWKIDDYLSEDEVNNLIKYRREITVDIVKSKR